MHHRPAQVHQVWPIKEMIIKNSLSCCIQALWQVQSRLKSRLSYLCWCGDKAGGTTVWATFRMDKPTVTLPNYLNHTLDKKGVLKSFRHSQWWNADCAHHQLPASLWRTQPKRKGLLLENWKSSLNPAPSCHGNSAESTAQHALK